MKCLQFVNAYVLGYRKRRESRKWWTTPSHPRGVSAHPLSGPNGFTGHGHDTMETGICRTGTDGGRTLEWRFLFGLKKWSDGNGGATQDDGKSFTKMYLVEWFKCFLSTPETFFLVFSSLLSKRILTQMDFTVTLYLLVGNRISVLRNEKPVQLFLTTSG